MPNLESRNNSGNEAAIAPPQSPHERRVHKGSLGTPVSSDGPRRVVVGRSATSLAGGPNGLLSVIGDDERSRIRETELAPFRMICALAISGPWGEFVGTGWLAGPRTIITAGHCVLDRAQMGGWAEEITVTPAQDGAEPPAFGTHTAKRFSTVDRWADHRDPNYDIGAIHLDEPIGDALGWFSVAALTDAELQNALVNVSGYPARPGGGVQQWWARNRVRALTPLRLFYDVDTSGGQSGGPVYLYEEADPDTPLVVGIHAYGTGGTPHSIPLEVNSAPRITADVVCQIAAWVEADGATVDTAQPRNA